MEDNPLGEVLEGAVLVELTDVAGATWLLRRVGDDTFEVLEPRGKFSLNTMFQISKQIRIIDTEEG